MAVPLACDGGLRCSGLLSASGEPLPERRSLSRSLNADSKRPTAAVVPDEEGLWVLSESEDTFIVSESEERPGPRLPVPLHMICAHTLGDTTYVTGNLTVPHPDLNYTLLFLAFW